MPPPIQMLLSVFISALPLAAASGQAELVSGDLPGMVILRTDRFEGKALFGYINGGADLYHEYGFVRLVVQNLTLDGDDQTAEVYEMRSDTAAFGIFSISRAGCAGSDSLGRHSCVSAYQTMFATGRLFVRVVNTKGDSRTSAGSLRTAMAIRRKAGVAELVLPGGFRREDWRGGRVDVQYVRGPLGVQNGAAAWADLLDGLEPYDAFLLAGSVSGAGVVAADIRFAAPDRAGVFIQRAANSARGTAITPTPTRILYFDGPDSLRNTIVPGSD